MVAINWLRIGLLIVLATLAMAPADALASEKKAPEPPLTEAGQKLEGKYAEQLKGLQAELSTALPKIDDQKKAALQKAHEALQAAVKAAETSQQSAGKTKGLEAKIANWKKFWIGKAEKGLAQAEAALKAATSDAAREAAKQDVAKWKANKEDGEKHIKEAQEELEKAKVDDPALAKVNDSAQATLIQARANELNAAKTLLADVEPCLSSDKLDAKLAKGVVLAHATPRGLAAFAQQGPEQAGLVDKLLADDNLMKEMLVAGGANYGKYGHAMEILSAIEKASPKANEGVLRRLALATSLEHAVPIKQNNAKDQTDAPATVDPVKRYLHYEKAYLDGELDPAFKNLNTWEYRMVIDCDAPDAILAWGREMLRNYRPDHVYDSNYGWRYSAAVRTDVRYGSQDDKNDLPSLNSYQNIPKDGGVCGRRAFFGRFILRAFGIPVWGVTQHKHAALSHWTPKGWVVNLGAGFDHSWWDKDEVSLSGTDFLLETQAREHAQDYIKVLRAQWVSRILGEPAYNGRKKVDGGVWSSLGHYQAVLLASQAVKLGPLGEELAEANEPLEKQLAEQAAVTKADQQIGVGGDGKITIPAVAHGKASGTAAAMKSFGGGMQLLGSGGLKTQYAFEAPQAGKYALTARVATVQEGQKFLLAANNAEPALEIVVPYTVGMWQPTPPVEIQLVKGQNSLNFSIRDGSRNVAIKEFTLVPLK